jgi:hypothetical protein
MSNDDDVESNFKGLENMIKALGDKAPIIRVGILGANGRSQAGKKGAPSNALIGAWHEFGTVKMAARSFLRMPLIDRLDKDLEKAGAFDEDVLKEVVKNKSTLPWARKVATMAEGIIAEAFATGGFGKWAPLKPSTLARKKNLQILVETQQLRNSITSEVR